MEVRTHLKSVRPPQGALPTKSPRASDSSVAVVCRSGRSVVVLPHTRRAPAQVPGPAAVPARRLPTLNWNLLSLPPDW